jgi:hypothetical protein
MTAQASSVSAERAFSSGTDLVAPDRCSLGGNTIEMTYFRTKVSHVAKMLNSHYN